MSSPPASASRLDRRLVERYLRRLGVDRPVRPTADALRALHLRHLVTVPFENLSVHLGEEIVLEDEALVEKIVGAGRGGFCYELNGAFGALLGALGFDVTLLAARVHGKEGRLGIPYDHLALLVRTVDAGEWLADVGFGELTHHPLRWDDRGEQTDPGGLFRLAEARPEPAGLRSEVGRPAGVTGEAGRPTGDGGRDLVEGDLDVMVADLDVVRDGVPQYRLETRARVLGDFAAGAWWHRTSPASSFTRSLVCSRITEDGGRITLSGRRLKVTGPDGVSDERELTGKAEVLGVYRDGFGIGLDAVPEVRGGVVIQRVQ